MMHPDGENQFRPGKLWSLLDMLGKYGAACIVAIEVIDKIQSNLKSVGDAARFLDSQQGNSLAFLGNNHHLPPDLLKVIEASLTTLFNAISERLPLNSTADQAKRISALLLNGASAKDIDDELRDLRKRFVDETNRLQFFYIPAEKVRFYTEPMLFGETVNNVFPNAIDDIECAGKCLALGQGTACVMHLMRVMECGLKGLAKMLGIPYAPSWESYISQITTKIGAQHKHKTPAWKKKEAFYRDLNGDLVAIKQSFRNPTMHVGRKYSPDEAVEIFAAVRTFMIHLSAQMKPRAVRVKQS